MGFLNPLLLWALPLAAVPIIIHLLNRRRYRTVRWAAMEFLLRAMKRNRRRLRMEQWIILALRTLAVILLVLLVARPHASGTVLGAVQTNHVVILDDSASMAHRGGAGSAYDAGKGAVIALAERLAQTRNGDLFTLVGWAETLKVNQSLAARVRDELSGWTHGDGVLDVASVLAEARTRALEAKEKSGAAQIEFYVVTDLRKRDWLAPDGRPNPAVNRWLLDLEPETERVTLLTVGPQDTENLAVTAVRSAARVCTLGVPLTFAVEVQNKGQSAAEPTEIGVAIDEHSRVVHPVPPLQPGEKAVVQITQTFHRQGYHGITASLPGDRYDPDDVRSLAFEIRAVSEAILVDGDPSTDEEESETYFLNVALNPGGETLTGIDARIVADHEFGTLPEEELRNVDMLWLCNVSRPDDATVERVSQFVEAGGGVVFWLGNQIDLTRYNKAFWADGKGLLPAELLDVQGDLDDPARVHLADKQHPIFAKNTEDLEFLFERWVRVGRWIQMREDDTAPARTLLRLGDEDGPLLMVTRTFGEAGGQVFVVGTTVDTQWTNWQITPVFMVTCQEIHANAARPQDFGSRNLLPHESFVATIDPGIYRPQIAVSSGDGEVRTFAARSAGGEPVDLEIPMGDLRGYGLFELKRRPHAGGEEVELISRNPNLQEGELQRLTRAGFLSTFPSEIQDRVEVADGTNVGHIENQLAGGGALWRWIGLGMLLGMLLETVLAWRFGRR